MILEENVIPEESIDEDNLSSQTENNIHANIDENDLLSTENKKQDVLKIDDYLSPDILDVKSYSSSDSLVVNDVDLNTVNLDETIYDNLNSNIQEKQVVEGTVVGIIDKGVIIDIGFKS